MILNSSSKTSGFLASDATTKAATNDYWYNKFLSAVFRSVPVGAKTKWLLGLTRLKIYTTFLASVTFRSDSDLFYSLGSQH